MKEADRIDMKLRLNSEKVKEICLTGRKVTILSYPQLFKTSLLLFTICPYRNMIDLVWF